jgi:hypothetical protein
VDPELVEVQIAVKVPESVLKLIIANLVPSADEATLMPRSNPAGGLFEIQWAPESVEV